MGSIDRFLSILIEHVAGNFPLWLSPVQVKVIPIKEEDVQFAHEEVFQKLKNIGIRVEIEEPEQLGKKVNEARKYKIPYTIVIGPQERQPGAPLAIRIREEDNQGMHGYTVDEFMKRILKKIDSKTDDLDLNLGHTRPI
jgi:threonyl-tRNA synthetase